MTVVGILGMTHDKEMQEEYKFPLSLVEKLITEFNPDVICGEVHPDSWELYKEQGKPYGILGETQEEYPHLIFPLCNEKGITFVPVNWFEEDVFEEEVFDRFEEETKQELEKKRSKWEQEKLTATWNKGDIPLNSFEYDNVTKDIYEWLHKLNPDVQNIQWNARHYMMVARVKNAIKSNKGKRILCIHGADHNYWYYQALSNMEEINVVYPLRS